MNTECEPFRKKFLQSPPWLQSSEPYCTVADTWDTRKQCNYGYSYFPVLVSQRNNLSVTSQPYCRVEVHRPPFSVELKLYYKTHYVASQYIFTKDVSLECNNCKEVWQNKLPVSFHLERFVIEHNIKKKQLQDLSFTVKIPDWEEAEDIENVKVIVPLLEEKPKSISKFPPVLNLLQNSGEQTQTYCILNVDSELKNSEKEVRNKTQEAFNLWSEALKDHKKHVTWKQEKNPYKASVLIGWKYLGFFFYF